ncbi:MAG: YARHG domain-containing protein, partial [Bacteroidota bacterium]
ASVDKLTRADVENMHKGDLEVMRNAIYARHGYSFKNRKMRYVFNYVDWYMPVSTDIRAQLTDIEKENIALLKRYEQHAERYYDSFGR